MPTARQLPPYQMMTELPFVIPGNESEDKERRVEDLLQGRPGRLDIVINHNNGEEERAGVEEMRKLASESEPGKAGVALAG
jgi:hypothetical protein